jgi:hypothetical protein
MEDTKIWYTAEDVQVLLANTPQVTFELTDTCNLDTFHASSRFGEVRIINQQTTNAVFTLTANPDFVPYLHIDMIKKFTPVYTRIFHKPAEYVLFAARHVA